MSIKFLSSSSAVILMHFKLTLEDGVKTRLPSGKLQEGKPLCFAHRGAREKQRPELWMSQDSQTSALYVHISLQVIQRPAGVQMTLESFVSQHAPGPQATYEWVSLCAPTRHEPISRAESGKKLREDCFPLHGCIGKVMPSGTRESWSVLLSPPAASTQLSSHSEGQWRLSVTHVHCCLGCTISTLQNAP